MAYIITEPCIGTKDTACVDVCPVDCIHAERRAGFRNRPRCCLHPDEGIERRLRTRVPGRGHYSLDETPHKWADFIHLNATLL